MNSMNTHRLIAFVLGIAVAASSLVTMTSASASTSDPTRIMVVGDSVSHGADGNYTWRYFSWKGLQATGANVDFVGPSTTTVNGGGYADPNFDQDHAAKWGFSMWEMTDHAWHPNAPRIDRLSEAYRPDVIVEMLGANDFMWFGFNAESMSNQVRFFVAEARSVNPGVSIVLAGVPQTWINDHVAVYNAGLPALAAELSTPESRVVAAPVAKFYEGLDTYDNVHPSVAGEIKLAKSVSVGLEALGIGKAIEMSVPAATAPLTPAVTVEPAPVVEPTPVLTPPVTIQDPPAASPEPTTPVLRIKALWKGRVRVTWAAHAGTTRVWVRCGSWLSLAELPAGVTRYVASTPCARRIKVRAASVIAGVSSPVSAPVVVQVR